MGILDEAAIEVENALRDIEGDEIYKELVYLVTKAWPERIGRDEPVIEKVKVDPNPYIGDFNHDLRLREGGKIKQGDLMLKYIPFSKYPSEDDVNCKTDSELIQKYYYIDGYLYNVISISKGWAYWNIQIRKANNNREEL
jgi:hypothetical protein